MEHRHHVLIVEDEFTTRTTLAAYFEAEGFRVTAVENGDQMRAALAQGGVDLVLLDIRLPGKDGLTLMRELRATSDVGIIMVTSKTDEVDRIIGLEAGADHYVTKPFSPRDLLARARSVLRRTTGGAAREAGAGRDAVRHFAGWTVDPSIRRLYSPDRQEVKLTRAEFDLLNAFVQNPRRVMTRDALLDHVSHRSWAPNDRSIDVLVGRLRRRIEADPNNPRFILTEHGVGYMFSETVT